MRTAINAAIIKDKRILLVKKHETWILPGGKPKKNELEIICLKREVNEELPGTRLENIIYYKDFIGTTPHTEDTLKAKVYFADIRHGPYLPAAEVNAYTFVNNPDNYNLSDITAKIIEDLRIAGYLQKS